MKIKFKVRHLKIGGTGRIHSKQTRMAGIREVDNPRQNWRLQ